MSDEQYIKTGRTMFLVAWAILFIVLFMFFYFHEKSDSKVYVSSHSELALSADKEGHYRIKGLINDRPVEFLIDTGATYVAIPQQLADELHIAGSYPIKLSTASGEVTGSLTRLAKINFGKFMLQDIKAVIVPGDKNNEVLLGMNVLSHFTLVQKDKILVLKQ